MDLYAENILDHYRHPRSKGRLPSPTVTREEVNLSCGDQLTLDLVITNDHIESIGWEGSGCAISQVAMSLLSEELVGKSVAEAEALTKEDIYKMLGVPIGPRRVKCALLCLSALQGGLRRAKDGAAHGN